jgi:two-component system phosphate regulon sensor histidine kinase PhoR
MGLFGILTSPLVFVSVIGMMLVGVGLWLILLRRHHGVSSSDFGTPLANTVNDFVIVVDHDGKILFVNHVLLSTLGYTEVDLTGQPLQLLLRDEWQLFLAKLIQPILQGTPRVEFEGHIYKKGEGNLPLHFVASPVLDASKKPEAVVCVGKDLVGLSKMQEATQERDRLSAILSSLREGIIVLNDEGRIIQVNQAAVRLFQRAEPEFLHRTLEDVLRFETDSHRVTSQDVFSLLEQQKDGSIAEYKELLYTTSSGIKAYFKMSVLPLLQPGQTFRSIILSLQDVTELHNEEKMKLDFVSIAAHELRTPLTVIRGYLSLFKQGFQFTLEQKNYLDRVDAGIRQLSFIIENFLNVSRIQRGVLTINTVSVNWVAFVKKVVNDLQPEAQIKQISLTFLPSPDELIDVRVDPVKMEEAVTNLINNAVNYTPNGGKIEVFLEKKENEIITHIRDNGKGIPQEALQNLFTKFYRVAGELSASVKGTGLGLFIVKTIVEMHKGKIWVNSEVGKGATFSFSLPIPHSLPLSPGVTSPAAPLVPQPFPG